MSVGEGYCGTGPLEVSNSSRQNAMPVGPCTTVPQGRSIGSAYART